MFFSDVVVAFLSVRISEDDSGSLNYDDRVFNLHSEANSAPGVDA
jgi:hypothetical protein